MNSPLFAVLLVGHRRQLYAASRTANSMGGNSTDYDGLAFSPAGSDRVISTLTLFFFVNL